MEGEDKYITLIRACWGVLICCFIVKILGGDYFKINCDNKAFIKICEMINNSFLYYVVLFTNYVIQAILYFKSILQIRKIKNMYLIFYPIIIASWIIKLLIKNNIVAFIIETIIMICTPLIFDVKKWKRAIKGFLLMLLFQLISFIIKDIGFKEADENILTYLIYMLDYYIMMVLYYLYSTKNFIKKKGD